MQVYLTEKIGDPDLFTGRRKELAFFLKWVEGVKRQHSKSMVLLSRRKTGKTALLQRLYNLIFHQNDGVVPFYYEIRESKQWALSFCCEFFLTFVFQYMAFKTRKVEYLAYSGGNVFAQADDAARREGLDYLCGWIDSVARLAEQEDIDLLWNTVVDAPRKIAASRNERVVQILDEFQYLNSEIYRDKETTVVMDDFAGRYMSTAEYRIAPLLISGSWVGWLRHFLMTMLPSRFQQIPLENLSQDEALEMIFNYSQLLRIPVTEETAYLIAQVSEGNPFYISALFHTSSLEQDLTTPDNVLRVLNYETRNARAEVKATWMEYILTTFAKVNERNAKNIVLYLSKYREREVSRKELLTTLQLDMTDLELEHKLNALVKSDIIEEGRSNFYYRGVQDNIFDKVFRSMYADDIEAFDPREVTNEYKALFEREQRKFRQLLGKYNYTKGLFAEFLIINNLRFHAYQQQDEFLAITHNLPPDFRFAQYESVWTYKAAIERNRSLEIDVFARAENDEYSLVCEVKNRDTKKFSAEEARQFLDKIALLQQREQLTRPQPFVFSLTGFTQDALDYFQEQGVAWSEDQRWLEGEQ